MTPVLPSEPTRLRPYDRFVWWGGLTVLGLTLAAGVAASLLAPMYAWAVPLILAAGAALSTLPRRSATALVSLLALFAVVSGHSEGLQPTEVVFALAQASYLGWWFLSRLFIHDEPLLKDAGDALMMAFLAYIPLSLVLTFLFGGDPMDAVGECLAISLMALYFPLREMIESSDAGLRIVVGAVLFFGVVGSFRVLGSVRAALSDAEYAWQVAQGRVPMNEMLLYSASLLSLCLASTARTWKTLALLVAAFTVFTLGMIMTQWRAYYIAWALAMGFLMLWGSGRVRVSTLTITVLGAAIGGAAAIVVLGDTVVVAFVGIAERILSIGSANSSDISLLNRYLEYEAVWPVILESPIFGHGPGVNFSFYDAIFKATWTKAYAHNTYLILWFKYGLVGLGLYVSLWIYSVLSALRLRRVGSELERATALFVAVALTGLTASSLVSVTLVTDDTAFGFGILFALSAGLRGRAARAAAG